MTEHEREILEAVAGKRDWPAWGAWVGACLSFLWEDGYITSETNPSLTEKGKQFLSTSETGGLGPRREGV